MAVVLIIGSLLVVNLLQLTGAEELLQQCDKSEYSDVTIKCPCDQVIHIRPAVVVCPLMERECAKRIINNHPSVVKCNRSSTCSIKKDIVNKLCDQNPDIKVVYDCVNSVPVPGPRFFYWCRTTEETANQTFTINRCPCDQVIRIHSAEVGFNDQCAGQNVECTKIITDHRDIKKCNGKRNCSINYLPPDKLCDQRQHGNFIKITYDCTNVFSFRACRASDNGGNHIFTLDTCRLTGQVINIQSAEIGFSSNNNPPECLEGKTCRNLTEHDEVWKFCNGKRNCSFSQNILNYTLCPNSSKNKNFISISYNCINNRNAAVMITTTTHSADSGITLTEGSNAAAMITTTPHRGKSGINLSEGAVAGIIVCVALLLLLLVIFIIIVICLCRKLASSKVNDAGNSRVENGPQTYEMASDVNSLAIIYTETGNQSEASAPAKSTQASAPPPRSSLNDITLVDNDLYQ